MANALPLILIAAAAVVILGKKKSSGEPGYAPGMGMDDPDDELDEQLDVVLSAARAAPPPFTISAKLANTPKPPEVEEVEDDVDEVEEEEPPKPAPKKCSKGSVTDDKRNVCWWQKGAKFGWGEPKYHRVVKYKTARAAAAASVLTPAHLMNTLSPGFNFALFCWLNRKRFYRCTKRYKVGKKNCKPGKWVRY